jgi:hypothetical protein
MCWRSVAEVVYPRRAQLTLSPLPPTAAPALAARCRSSIGFVARDANTALTTRCILPGGVSNTAERRCARSANDAFPPDLAVAWSQREWPLRGKLTRSEGLDDRQLSADSCRLRSAVEPAGGDLFYRLASLLGSAASLREAAGSFRVVAATRHSGRNCPRRIPAAYRETRCERARADRHLLPPVLIRRVVPRGSRPEGPPLR